MLFMMVANAICLEPVINKQDLKQVNNATTNIPHVQTNSTFKETYNLIMVYFYQCILPIWEKSYLFLLSETLQDS